MTKATKALVDRANELLALKHELEAAMTRYCAQAKFVSGGAIYTLDAGYEEIRTRLCRVDWDWIVARTRARDALIEDAGLLP